MRGVNERRRDSKRRADLRFSGLYLAYKTDNSVNIPYSSASDRTDEWRTGVLVVFLSEKGRRREKEGRHTM